MNQPIRPGATLWRRAAAGLASMVLATSCIPISAGSVYADDSDTSASTFDDGTLTYTILNSTQVAVTDCTDAATHISIMPEIDGYDVVAIGEEAFAECENLQGLTIPSSVTEIGDAAFYGCTSLQSLTIPDGVAAIPAGCFFSCTSLTDLTLGSGITEIGDMAFGYCTALEEIALPQGVTTLGDQLFYYCLALQGVEIPETVTALGSYTFYGCMSLTEFIIPATLEDIGAMSFLGCQGLTSIAVQDGNPSYSVVDNVLYNHDGDILYLYPAGRTDAAYAVPDGTLVIYAGAFFSAGNLQQITLNDDLQYIGEMAFDFCTSLESITIPESVTTIGNTAFSDCSALQEVIFAGADREDGGEGEALEIAEFAFFCCDALSEVRLPKRVSTIGSYAFGCTSPDEEEATDADDVITIDTDSGTTLEIMALDGFVLRGYTGVASDYAKTSEVKVNFDSINFDWATFFTYGGLILGGALVLLAAAWIVKRNMMTRAERDQLRQAVQAKEEAADDGYQSIIAPDEDEDPDPAPASQAVAAYEQTISHASLHQIGHSNLDPAAEPQPDNQDKTT